MGVPPKIERLTIYGGELTGMYFFIIIFLFFCFDRNAHRREKKKRQKQKFFLLKMAKIQVGGIRKLKNKKKSFLIL